MEKEKSEMREQSYKDRKKKLMENIKKEIKAKQEDSLKMLKFSYHSTASNN